MPRDVVQELLRVAAQPHNKRAGFTLQFTELFPKEEGQPSPPPKARKIDLSTAAGHSRAIRANEKSVSSKSQLTGQDSQGQRNGSTSLPTAGVQVAVTHTLKIYECMLCSKTSTARSAGPEGQRPSIEKHIRTVHAITDWESVVSVWGTRFYYTDRTSVEIPTSKTRAGGQPQQDNVSSSVSTSGANRGKGKSRAQSPPSPRSTAAARTIEARKVGNAHPPRQTTQTKLQWGMGGARETTTQTRTGVQAGKARGENMGNTSGNTSGKTTGKTTGNTSGNTTGKTVATARTSTATPSLPAKRRHVVVIDSDDEEEDYTSSGRWKFQKRG